MGNHFRAIIDGKVQGVCFRAKTQKQALSEGFLGFVRNLPNGCVEIVIQGSKSNLERLIQKLKEHADTYNITTVEISPFSTKENFTDFSIRY